MKKQVNKSHYAFDSYMHKARWISVWHQLDEVKKLNPKRVLEVGPGLGVFKSVAGLINIGVETLDIDPELKPDYLVSVFDMPFDDGEFDVVCAFQMLEHLPFEKSIEAFKEMVRVANNYIVISLPNAATRWPIKIHIPKLGEFNFSIPRPILKRKLHKFDGEHYWELEKAGYSVNDVIDYLSGDLPLKLKKVYRVPDNPYHHFFIFAKNNK